MDHRFQLQSVRFLLMLSLVWPSGFRLRAEVSAVDGGPPVPVIDIHTHVFNARDLPLAGAISAKSRSWLPAPLATTIKECLLKLTAPDDLEAVSVDNSLERNTAPSSTTRALALAENEANGAESERSLSEAQRRKLLSYLGRKPIKGAQTLLTPDETESDASLLASVLLKAGFQPWDAEEDELIEQKLLDKRKDGILGFVNIMTEGNFEISRRLVREEYPKVDLFIHHMMDMERAYDEKPQFAFAEQMVRMNRLDQRWDGRLAHFTAFDPFRRAEAMSYVEEGLQAGAMGVKFYPPSGYRPTTNRIPSKPSVFQPATRHRWNSRYENLKSEDLDALTEALFAYCVSNDIPIFAHCTPAGFQAAPGYGWMSDPVYWELVLQKHPTLRLCLGHSGGEAFWFPKPALALDAKQRANAMFGEKVLNLCLTYSNVFCEVGYLDSILEPKGVQAFTNRLADLISMPSMHGNWTFGDKLMYGTDWHMIHVVKHHTDYLAQFDEIFAQPPFASYRRQFFAGNAARFLRLETMSQDPRFTAAQKDYWGSLLARTAVRPSAK